jgi:hypothetical protein
MTVPIEKADFQKLYTRNNKKRFEKAIDEKHIRIWETTLNSNRSVKALLLLSLVEMGFSENAARRVLSLSDTDTIREK